MSYIFFARWFGIVSILLSLGILSNLEDAKEMAKHMIKSGSGYIMGGVLPIIFGSLAFLQLHMDQKNNQQVLIALVGLAMIFLGCYRVFFPQHWRGILHRHLNKIPPLFSLFGLMFGVALIYIGFVAHSVR